MAHSVEVEIERNYAVFVDMLDDLLQKSPGQYVVLHSQKLEGVYPTAAAAGKAAIQKFNDGPFSIQLVSKEPVDLGFYSYATGDR